MRALVFLMWSCLAFAKEGVYPLSFEKDDLAPLDSIIKNAEIVGLGESGHASSGFLKARLKVIKHLVEKKDFRTIILENGYLTTEKFNNYLQACSKGRRNEKLLLELLLKQDIIYRNEEMRETFQWLCSYNINNPKDAVSFFGMDVWEEVWDNRNIIEKFVRAVNDESVSKAFAQSKENCFSWKANNAQEAQAQPEWAYLLRTWRIEPERNTECVGGLLSMSLHIEYNRSKLEATIGKEIVFWADLALQVQQTWQAYRDLYLVDFPRVLNLRDRTQAQLTLAMYGRGKKKAIMLAHNVHIAKKQSEIIPRSPGWSQWINVRSAGELLKGYFGQKYKAIALSGYEVSSARDGDYPLPVADDSLDNKLAQRGEFLLVDPKANWIREQGEWWMHAEMDLNGWMVVPENQYDGIIFMKKSEKAVTLKNSQKLL